MLGFERSSGVLGSDRRSGCFRSVGSSQLWKKLSTF